MGVMVFLDLSEGDRFELGGKQYEVQMLGERVILAYVLDAAGRRIPDPDDVVGDTYLTDFFSDLRFNREHETPEDAARFEDLT